MLNFLPKTRQNKFIADTREWVTKLKNVGLQRLAQAVAGHAAHGQREQHHGNAEVIGHRQAVFCLWRPH